ncbi:MAG TPA: tetratricopeptide repeat protein [Burkholderiales bacterium]|nr:tetratricopeptide repeat protein [Burkholderiales bacterium]
MKRAAIVLLLAGCAAQTPAPVVTTTPTPAPTETPVPAPSAPSTPATPTVLRPATKESTAIASLMDSARADTAAGRLSNAAATLERALRIEPRNPRLWSELARVRFQQRDYAQAESTALRSESWAGKDNLLRADNWRLIAAAREARGDSAGARQARESASRFEK